LLLSSKESSDRSPLVPIRPDGDRAPLFLVHGIGSEFLFFDALVRHLPPAQPVYGLRGCGPDLPPRSSPTIESMAAIYAEAMRRVHRGPYQVAAYSAGGILAYELAQQLLAGGDQVALLTMLDAQVPPELPQHATERRHWTPAEAFRFANNLGWWIVDDLLASNGADLLMRARSKARLLRARLRRDGALVHGGREQADIRDRLGVPRLPQRYVPWLEAYLDAIEHYQPQPYPGRIVVLRARTRPLFGRLTHDRGWGALAQGRIVDVRVIAGDHANILREPRVRLLAAALTSAMDEGSFARGTRIPSRSLSTRATR
jgi:thioesterase domain-containing protein